MTYDRSFFRQHWAEKRLLYDRIKQRGDISATWDGPKKRRIHVAAPYDPEFRKCAQELGATWLPKIGVWSFIPSQRRLIGVIVGNVYGLDKIPDFLKVQPGELTNNADERPNEPPREPDASDPLAWESRCAGCRSGVHEKAGEEDGGEKWRCRWCWQVLKPPMPKPKRGRL